MRHRALVRAGLVVLSLAVSLALGEVALRLYERHTLSLATRLNADPVDLGALRFNETVVPRARPAGEFRILSFGDSFAYSIMAPPFSYAGLVGDGLGRALGRPVRVVNLGEGATTVRDYTAAHRFWAERLAHDGALFNVYLGNDVLDVAYGFTGRTWIPNHLYLRREYGELGGAKKSPIPEKFPLRLLDHAYASYLTRSATMEPRRPPGPPDPRFNRAANHNLTEAAFLDVNRAQLVNFEPAKLDSLAQGYLAIAEFFRYVSDVRRRGTRTLVVLSPNQAHAEAAFRQRLAAHYRLDLSAHDLTLPARVITALRDAVDPAIEMVDLSPHFVCASDRGAQLYYLTNTHWGAEGNALAARLIGDHLARSWFGRAPSNVDADCDVAAYRSRFSRVDQTVIAGFVERLVAALRNGRKTG